MKIVESLAELIKLTEPCPVASHRKFILKTPGEAGLGLDYSARELRSETLGWLLNRLKKDAISVQPETVTLYEYIKTGTKITVWVPGNQKMSSLTGNYSRTKTETVTVEIITKE